MRQCIICWGKFVFCRANKQMLMRHRFLYMATEKPWCGYFLFNFDCQLLVWHTEQQTSRSIQLLICWKMKMIYVPMDIGRGGFHSFLESAFSVSAGRWFFLDFPSGATIYTIDISQVEPGKASRFQLLTIHHNLKITISLPEFYKLSSPTDFTLSMTRW